MNKPSDTVVAEIDVIQRHRRFLISHPKSVAMCDAALQKYQGSELQYVALEHALRRANSAAQEAFDDSYRRSGAPALKESTLYVEIATGGPSHG